MFSCIKFLTAAGHGCGKVVDELVDRDGGGHEDELDAGGVGAHQLLAEEEEEVHVLLALVDLVQNDVRPIVQVLLG